MRLLLADSRGSAHDREPLVADFEEWLPGVDADTAARLQVRLERLVVPSENGLSRFTGNEFNYETANHDDFGGPPQVR